jgi:creatinine amidohydrolase
MITYHSTREEIENSNVDTAVIPIGSVEQHGPHLPIGTDFMIAEKIAAEVSDRIGALLLPVLPISTCREHKGSKGSVWMNSDTFYHMLKDITECLRVQGFKKVILIIAHGGVFISGPAVREINSDNDDIKLIRVDIVNFISSLQAEGILESDSNLHACEYETSLMLFLNDKLVRKDRIEDCGPEVPRDFLNYASILKFSKNGVWGRPSLANVQKGEHIFNLMVQWSVDYINNVNKIFE